MQRSSKFRILLCPIIVLCIALAGLTPLSAQQDGPDILPAEVRTCDQRTLMHR